MRRIAIVQSCLCNLTQQPQSVSWKLDATVDNTPGLKAMEHQKAGWMEVAHKWARWLHNPCRLGGPDRFRAGGRIRSGPQVGKVAT